MQATSSTPLFFRRYAFLGIAVLLCAQTSGIAAQEQTEKMRRYESDRRACLSGKSDQVLDSCLKEAKAVLTEAPGGNPVVSPDQLTRNASIRCETLTGDERIACLARMRGEGTVSGSVAGGGMLRELVTTEVAPKPPRNPTADVRK